MRRFIASAHMGLPPGTGSRKHDERHRITNEFCDAVTGEEKHYKAPVPSPVRLMLPSAKPSPGNLEKLVSPVSTCVKPASFMSAG